jgi:DNA (cytosine-5)-methyltransferase 1
MAIRVVELFAGVGGFRIGLEGPPGGGQDSDYKVVWSNQWEPSTKKQHAAEVYVERWNLKQSEDNPLEYFDEEKSECFVNEDIAKVDAKDIPDHELLVGGFPCQDYSVARTANQASGIEGKKGVLWWQILRILEEKRPPMVLLENVDRLLKSPSSQRGRDFAVMLASLSELDYVVEWRVINAADYGMPQRRRRVFILAYAKGTKIHSILEKEDCTLDWIQSKGTLAKAFPIDPLGVLLAVPSPLKNNQEGDLADISDNFNKGAKPAHKSPFKRSGIMISGNYYTYDVKPNYNGKKAILGDVLLSARYIHPDYCLEPDSIMKEKGWKYFKGSKKEERQGTDGFTYLYNEGPMVFPDSLDAPSRTIITGEGGKGVSRFKHVVRFRPTKKMREQFHLDGKEATDVRESIGLKKSEWLRRLTPIELERLNMFPDNHTEGPTDGKRAFFMGNALVVGIIENIGHELLNQFE